MKLSNKEKAKMYESIMKGFSSIVYKHLMESDTAVEAPSVQRWLDDQINMNKPKNLEEVKHYLAAKDDGSYELCTNYGDMIMQNFCNAYIQGKLPWLQDYNLMIAVTKSGKLASVNCHIEGMKVLIESEPYDFDKTFTENLGIICKKTVEFLKPYTTLEEFEEVCLQFVREARESGKKLVSLQN